MCGGDAGRIAAELNPGKVGSCEFAEAGGGDEVDDSRIGVAEVRPTAQAMTKGWKLRCGGPPARTSVGAQATFEAEKCGKLPKPESAAGGSTVGFSKPSKPESAAGGSTDAVAIGKPAT